MKPIEENGLGACQNRDQKRRRKAERMEQRKESDGRVFCAEADQQPAGGDVAGEVAVGEHHSLRQAGRAGGIEDGGEVGVFPNGLIVHFGQRGNIEFLQYLYFSAHGLGLLFEWLASDDEIEVGVAANVFELMRIEQEVDRNGHFAGNHAGEVRIHEFAACREQNADFVR